MGGVALVAQILNHFIEVEWEFDSVRFHCNMIEGVMQVSERTPCRTAG
jgi:hypothetical protein